MNTSKCACCFKDVPVFSHYCAFVWTGLSDTCGREFFENGEKKISLFNHKRRRVSRENLRTQAFLAIYNTPEIAEPLMHQSIPPAPSPPPPRATAGHLPALSVPGMGHLQILHCLGAGHLPTPGLFPSFLTRMRFPSRM